MTDISIWPVMKARCPTCPFGDGTGKDRVPEIANMVRQRCLTEASQICHHPRLHGKPEKHLCRGARDYQLEIFHRLGVIREPTDKAWNEARGLNHDNRKNTL
jgi:hypothetical protein